MNMNGLEQNERVEQAYKLIMQESLSLRAASEQVGIERKKLKTLIENTLNEEEMVKFQDRVSSKNKKEKNTGRVGRDKKKKALESYEYIIAIGELAKRKILPEWIDKIYLRCQEKKQTKIAKDTLAIKLVELLEYFDKRNDEIQEDSPQYLTSEDVVDMILRCPRLITMGLEKNIIVKIDAITSKNNGNIGEANNQIRNNPSIFTKSLEQITK